MGKQATIEANQLKSFWEAETARRLRYLKVAHVPLSILVLLAASVLDYFFYPQLFSTFLWIRALGAATLCAYLLLLLTPFAERHVVGLGLFWGVFMNYCLSILIFLSEGANSPYYAGINLVLLGVVVLLSSTVRETMFVICVSVIMYVAACLFHMIFLRPFVDWTTFFNNMFFLVMTCVICIVSSHFMSRSRYQDFFLRQELDVRNRKLEELDRLKTQFFANISHELRTPLTLVLSPVENLLNRGAELNGHVRQALELTYENALRLLRLINDLLEIVRLDGRALVLHKQPISLGDYLPGIVESVRHLGNSKHLEMRAIGCDQPVAVMADPSRLERVFLNLLTNAVKFTATGGEITVRWSPTSNNTVAIQFEDTGTGIPAEELPYIFDRFHRGKGGSSGRHHGLGLGLALAREIVEEHDGSLRAESDMGKGTTFTVELPLSKELPQGAASAARAVIDDDPIADSTRKADRFELGSRQLSDEVQEEADEDAPLVLMVDDEPDIRKLLDSFLRSDYRLLQAADGVSGLALAREMHPDAILLDMMLPNMNGLEVCSAIKADSSTRNIKVIMLTARADEQTKIESLRSGADDYLTKPFSTVEVKTRLENLLTNAALQKALRLQNLDLEKALTDLKNTESQLVQNEKMVALGTLSAGLLHEINNPLNFTLTAIRLVLDSGDDLDPDTLDSLNDIDEGMKRIRDIVTGLRAFAHPEEIDRRDEFKMSAAIDTALKFTAHLRNGVQVESRLSKEDAVLGSRNHITQVLVNLLINAVNATESHTNGHEARIRIQTEARDHRLFVSVADNGSGIDPKILPRIFDPFFTTRNVGSGMGLGLSVCHTIVKNHGGKIEAHSDGRSGSTMTFDLALA